MHKNDAMFVKSFHETKNEVVIDIKSSWSSNSFTPLQHVVLLYKCQE